MENDSKSIKLLLVIGSLKERGGTEKQVMEMACELEKKGIVVEIATLDNLAHNIETRILNNIEIHKLNLLFKNGLLSFLISIRNYIKLIIKKDYDIVHLFLPESILISMPLFAMFSKRTKIVCAIRGSQVRRNFLVKKVYLIYLKYANYITVNSEHLRDMIIKENKIKKNKIFLLHNGIYLPRESSNYTSGVAVISNFHWFKGHKYLIDAISLLRIRPEFIFMGQGTEQESIKKLVNERNLQDCIKFVGLVNPSDYLNHCLFAIHPSTSEGLSNAIIEELSFGLPVIAGDIDGNKNLIIDKYNGLTYSVTSSNELAKCIEYLQENEATLNVLRKNARLSVLKYSWNKIILLHLDFYKNLLK